MGLQINLGLQQQLIVLIVSLPLGFHPSPLGPSSFSTWAFSLYLANFRILIISSLFFSFLQKLSSSSSHTTPHLFSLAFLHQTSTPTPLFSLFSATPIDLFTSPILFLFFSSGHHHHRSTIFTTPPSRHHNLATIIMPCATIATLPSCNHCCPSCHHCGSSLVQPLSQPLESVLNFFSILRLIIHRSFIFGSMLFLFDMCCSWFCALTVLLSIVFPLFFYMVVDVRY